MITRSQNMPGAGFVMLTVFAMILALFASWIFDTTRIESTILLEEKGLQQLYRNHHAEALDYFYQSALVDTDKFHHILRYLDSFRLAIQSGNAEMADFFFNELADESPDLLGTEEIFGLLQLQPNPTISIDLIIRIVQIDSIDKQEVNQAVSEFVNTLDDQTRPSFMIKLKQALQANLEQLLIE